MDSSTVSLGVFKGPDSLAQYFDPDKHPLLPLVELPAAFNPLAGDGVRIFAKMLTALPAQNVKSLPALNMLRNCHGSRKRTIVEASSGSTALSLGMIAKALWNHDDVHAYVTNKKHVDSLRTLRFFGLRPVLYGGLAQQEPSDPKGIMNRLRNMQKENPDQISYPGQYENHHNWKAHEQWTGAQIWRQLPEINVLCTTVGTGGCATGTGKYLKSKKHSVKVVGVCNVFGDPTPGPRHFPGFETSQFPWRETIDTFETVSSVDSYRWSMKLSRHGIICGPSSGEALQGLLAYLGKANAAGELHELADPETGQISCVFICADLPYQYMNLYFNKLGDEEFPPIINKDLLTCDLDQYDERWFLTPEQACEILSFPTGKCTLAGSSIGLCKEVSETTAPDPTSEAESSASTQTPPEHTPFTPPSPGCASSWVHDAERSAIIVDIRPSVPFEASHVQGSINVPLPGTIVDFYGDPKAVRSRWGEVKGALGDMQWLLEEAPEREFPPRKRRRISSNADLKSPRKKTVLFICSDGDSSKMAAAMTRGKGTEAFCIDGGFSCLESYLVDGIVESK